MPSALIKRNDAWINIKEGWVKRSGVWTKAQQIFQKIDDVWTLVQTPPQPPPQPPVVALEIDPAHRIRVGVRYPAIADDPNIRKIRVLASRTEMPTSQFGSGEIKEADADWKGEYWSNWAFDYSGQDYRPTPVQGNGLGDGDAKVNIVTGEPDPNGTLVYRIHADTSVQQGKMYPPNSTATNPLPAGTWYYFAGWTLDVNDQWSVGTFNKIFMPQPNVTTGLMVKEAVFQALSCGYLEGGALLNGPDGDLITVSNQSQGVFFFGNRITNTIGEHGPISGAVQGTVRLTRDDDPYSPTANVWMYWHDITNDEYVPPANRFDKVKIGVIAKGETKSFEIPVWANNVWANQIKGIGFGWSTAPVTADSSIFQGVGRNPRAGELSLRWAEDS